MMSLKKKSEESVDDETRAFTADETAQATSGKDADGDATDSKATDEAAADTTAAETTTADSTTSGADESSGSSAVTNGSFFGGDEEGEDTSPSVADDQTQAMDTDKTRATASPAAGQSDAGEADRTQAMDTVPATEDAADSESTDPNVKGSDAADKDRQRVTHGESDDQQTQSIAAQPVAAQPQARADRTQPLPAVTPSAEDEDLRQQETERRRAERDAALGNRRRRPAEEAQPAPVAARPAPAKRSTDKFFGSLGLMVLRVVMAAVMALHGLTHIFSLDQTMAMIDGSWLGTMVGQPLILAYVLGVGELLVAVSLLFGFGTRIAGVAMVAIGALALAMVHWTQNPFDGFALDGEPALMVAAIGFAFFAVGAGGWSADRGIRIRRQERKAARR